MRRSDLLRSRAARGRTALVALLAAGAAGLALLPAHDASAQLMIKIREPNVLLVLDNSASMAFTPEGTGADCQNGDESKWYIAASALTGTVADPWCKSSGTLTANEDFSGADNSWIAFGDDNGGGPGNKQVCVAAPRRSDFAWSRSENPGRWYMTGGGSQPITYRTLKNADTSGVDYNSSGSSTCTFDQSADGAIDAFKDRLRIGLATVDPLQDGLSSAVLNSQTWTTNYPKNPSDQKDWMPQQQVTDQQSAGFGNPNFNWSYWHNSSGGSWSTSSPLGFLLGGRYNLYPDPQAFPAGSNPLVDPTFSLLPLTSPKICPVLLDTRVDASLNFTGCADNYDMGIRNSYAAPWNGRLIGFGTPTASTSNVLSHNGMVELAIQATGPWMKNSTPLAAMMRDVHEFMRDDTHSTGAQYPNDPNYWSNKIGPENDSTYVVNGCRDQAVVLVSDGLQYHDLAKEPADYAFDLYADAAGSRKPVSTYVLGIGATSFEVDKGSGLQTFQCETDLQTGLGTNEFGVGGACEYDAANHKFKLAGSETVPGSLTACCTLAKVAIEGGPNSGTGIEYRKRFFMADNSSDARAKLNAILGDVAGITISRTVPVFARSSGVTSAAPAASYELFSALNVNTNGGVWDGMLHRLRNVCTGSVLSKATIGATSALGDRFEDNLLNASTWKRKFWTVVTSDDNSKDASRRSIRPNDSYNAKDGLKAGTAKQTDLVEADDLGSEISSKWGVGVGNWLNISNGGKDKKACKSAFGVSGGGVADTCGEMLLTWLGGKVAGTAAARTKPLGGIWRSNPVIVEPPRPDISEESFSAEVRTGTQAGNPSFVVQQKERPTMAYVQSIDGLLHAFVVQRNKATSTNPNKEYYDDVPPSDDGQNNELWSFIPPAVARQLWPNYNKHARILDGPITVRDVAWRRTQTQRQDNFGEWHTVLVASGGYSTAGGFYYAIDVTNPLHPEFLWQISRQEDLKPLFGDVVPGAAITTLRVSNGTATDLVPVALLPGGQSASPAPTSNVQRRSWSPGGTGTPKGWKINASWPGTGHKPRQYVTDWGPNRVERSLTIVDLQTGEILGRMVGENGDQFGGIKAAVDIDEDRARFDSPMAGMPVPFPDYPGQPASRAYIGDVDGTMWRIDLSSNIAADWEAAVAWDAYNLDSLDASKNGITGATMGPAPSATAAATMGQPIQLDPIVSVDEDGNPVVMFATGDQEQFQSASPGMVNWSVSFSDPFVATLYAPELLTDLGYKNGVRVTGPLTLFDGQLYMTYFQPSATGTCTLGASGWCAFDYADTARAGKGTPGDGYADAVVDIDGNGTFTAGDICADLPGSDLVFGMSLFQQPSCEVTATDFGDAWFGGQYRAYGTTTSGSYKLIMHTSETSVGSDDVSITTSEQTLAAPQTSTRIVSWTNVVE